MIDRSDLAVYLVTAEPATAATLDLVEQAVHGGVRVVQLRDKNADTRKLIMLLRRLRERLPDTVTLLANDDVEAAAAVAGVGVHLGPDDHRPADARARLGPEVCIGWSLHHRDQLADSGALAASDYVAVSPVWATPTKTDTTTPWGLDGVGELRTAVDPRMPLVAIGGIGPDTAADVVRAGADGIAVVSAICAADDPAAAAQELRRIVGSAQNGSRR